jgi:predicted DCC family thiol-disulfide oxidoreductase YuxK
MIQNIGTSDDGTPLVLAALNKDEHAALARILRIAEDHLDEIQFPKMGSRLVLAQAMIRTLREVHGIKPSANHAASA